jgi:hypothetical protein
LRKVANVGQQMPKSEKEAKTAKNTQKALRKLSI